MTLALTWAETAWWITLAAGLVVALVVWALLEWLRRVVRQVQRGADEVLLMGGRVAQNTWTVQLLETTKLRAGELGEELEQAVARGGER